MKRTSILIALAAAAAGLATTARAERNYLAWGRRHDVNLSSTQRGVAVAMDRRGNVAMTGYNDVADQTWYTVKYDALTGATIWAKSYTGGVDDDRPAAIATDSEGNVIVTGFTTGANQRDYYTIKYAAADGTILWQKRYNNAQNGADEAVAVVVDGSDNVIVTGKSIGTGTQEDFHTIKYSAANGTELWSRRYNSAGNFPDIPRALAVGANGDVAVAGLSRVGGDQCYYTAKYAAADGSVTWEKTFDSANNDNDVATGVAFDSLGNVLVTGYVRGAGGNYSYHTRKYTSANGTVAWGRTYTAPGGNGLTPAFIGTDADDNAIIAGTAVLDGFRTVYYATKYAGSNGNTMWENHTDAAAGSPANTFVDDDVRAMVVDATGNAIVTGVSDLTEPVGVPDTGDDYLTVKFDGVTGDIAWEQRLNGDQDSGTDAAAHVAVDLGGNVAVTGTARKPPGSPYSQIITARYNRFLLTVGDPVTGTGLTPAAYVFALNTPATGDNGAIATHIKVKDGTKLYAAILPQGAAGGNTVSALQGQPAPGVTGGLFKSFSDTVCAPNGTYAFSGKLSGVPGTQAAGVWTNTYNGTLQLALQLGTQVPGLDAGVVLKSVTSISLQNGQLVALITVKGTNVTAVNSSVLISLTGVNTGVPLLRTGQMVTADGTQSAIKKLSVYVPPKTSPGHGRYHGQFRTVANALLADKRKVILSVTNAGVVTAVAAMNGDAAIVAAGAKWKAFGPYGAGSAGFSQATLAQLAPVLGGVKAATDTAIVASSTGAAVNSVIAREGSPASGVNGAIYFALNDPVSNNQGTYAFIAKIKGLGIPGSANTLIYHGSNATPDIIARTGSPATDALGNPLTQNFALFKTLALPGGAGSGPIFIATVKGTGVTGKNSLGLWGVDSEGFLRQLLRNGDAMGPHTVKKFTMLNSVTGAFSASRSFNNTGGVTALVDFADKTKAIVYVGIP